MFLFFVVVVVAVVLRMGIISILEYSVRVKQGKIYKRIIVLVMSFLARAPEMLVVFSCVHVCVCE